METQQRHSPTQTNEDEARRLRFQATLAAIRAASQWQPPMQLSDEELKALVDEARKTRRQQSKFKEHCEK